MSVFIFSYWNLFNEILDEPLAHGFDEGDPTKAEGGIWLDKLHPTTEVHRILAKSVMDFLCAVKENEGESEDDIEVVFS